MASKKLEMQEENVGVTTVLCGYMSGMARKKDVVEKVYGYLEPAIVAIETSKNYGQALQCHTLFSVLLFSTNINEAPVNFG